MILRNIICIVLLLLYLQINAQTKVEADTLKAKNKLNFKAFIIPSALIAYGAISLNSRELNKIDENIEARTISNNKTSVDDYLRYVPAVSVYVLNNIGIEGKNNLRDRSIILGTSYLIMVSTTFGLKAITKIERPDGSDKFSFPSGHASAAFVGAEFLWQEYKHKSVWYGIAGYVVATGTGYGRLYNNKHWFSDVVTGAGIGIVSTKLAYIVFPHLNNKIFKSNNNKNSTMLLPYYNGKQLGIGMLKNF